ncbi:MAG: hypothetical protein WD669_05195 [Pirellulales bacterium]
MQRRNHTWPRIAVALIVAVPLAIAWAAIGTWLFSLVEDQLFPTPPYAHEMLQIAGDGTPVIETIVRSSYQAPEAEYRSLDGSYLKVQREDLLNGAAVIVPTESDTFLPTLITWKERVAGISDSQRRGTDWYLVRPVDPLGPAYFIGYDAESEFPVGYIGNAGFRPGLPPREEWFDLPRRPLSYLGGVAATNGYLAYAARAVNYYPNYAEKPPLADGARPWQVFLVDGDRLCEIDLRTRKARTVHEAAGPASISIIYQPSTPRGPTATNNTAADEASAKSDEGEAAPASKDIPLIPLVALRTTDRIIIINPASAAAREFPLPAELRDKLLNAYVVPGESLLVSTWIRAIGNTPPVELSWLSPDGRVTRHETVKLASATRPQMGQAAWVAAAVVPMPVAWLYFVGSAFSIDATFAQEDTSHADAVLNTIRQVWPVAAAVAAFGAVLAWLTYRLQRKYHRPASAAWCTFVFLLGPPGFLAYLIEHRRAKLETCPQCKASVPRDREACAVCDTIFPPPQRMGTEIFA